MNLSHLLLSAGATILVFGLWKIIEFLYALYKSPLRSMPGPSSSHIFYGNFAEIMKAVRYSSGSSCAVVLSLKN